MWKIQRDKTIYVFGKNPTFTPHENKYIEDNGITVDLLDDNLHPDASIDVLKRKIISLFNKKISFDEIYLYAKQEQELSTSDIWRELTRNGKQDVTYECLMQFLANIQHTFSSLEKKDHYTYTDLLELDLNHKRLIDIPVGQKCIIHKAKYHYVANPFNITVIDPELERLSEQSITTQNGELLLTLGKIHNNMIHVVFAEDIIKYFHELNIDNFHWKTIMNIYFPFLARQNIFEPSELLDSSVKLRLKNKDLLDKAYKNTEEVIDYMYSISQSMEVPKIIYQDKGIQYLKCIQYALTDIIMPLEVIFKQIHATKKSPLIKFTPSIRQEKMYRLFSRGTTQNGKKVPYLEKAKIIRLGKEIANKTAIAFYLETNYKETIIPVTIELDKFGGLQIELSSQLFLVIDEMERHIQDVVNPIIDTINTILLEGGYSLKHFTKIESTEIIEIKYRQTLEIQNNLQLKEYSGCVSKLFNVFEEDLKKGIKMRYKRVSNYNKMNAQYAFIIALINQGKPMNLILESLEKNFDLSYEEAQVIYGGLLGEIEIEQGINENKRLRVRNNPGFLTTITLQGFTNTINILVENINNVGYLETLPKMLYSFILLVQGLDHNDKIKTLCKHTKEEKKVEDIVALAEQSYNKVDEVQLDDEDDDDDFFNALLDDDEEDEDEEDDDDDDEDNKDGESHDDEDNEDDDDTIKKTQSGGQLTNYDEILIDFLGSSSDEEPPLDKSITGGSSPNEAMQISPEHSEDVYLNTLQGDIPTPNHNDSVNKEYIDDIMPISDSDEYSESDTEMDTTDMMKNLSINDSSLNKLSNSDNNPDNTRHKIELVSAKDNFKKNISGMNLSSKDYIDDIMPISESDEYSESDAEMDKEIDTEMDKEIDTEMDKEMDTEMDTDIIKNVSTNASSLNNQDDTTHKTSTEVPKENFKKDITGMNLSNPNYFSQRMENRDPKLFVKSSSNPAFKSYSRLCPSNVKRQPVILTKEEKERIDKEHPGSYQHSVKYGSDPNNPHYYICPRYWCLKNNTSLTEEEVNSGVCGGRDAIIPEKAKKVPPGKYIYEFSTKREHIDKDGKYLQHYPGFISGKSHPDGLCMPCCFKRWDAPQQQQRRKECSQEKTNKPTKQKPVEAVEVKEYIKGADKFPLDQNHWGFLPLSLQIFLNVDREKCVIKGTTLNSNVPCLLRHGIELDKRRSFIACIADLYVNFIKDQHIPTIDLMLKKIYSVINLDSFMEYNNGNLVQLFKPKEETLEEDNSKKDNSLPSITQFDQYKDTHIYSMLDLKKSDHVKFLNNIINAMENFKAYLQDPTQTIDHTYLWDIITTPHPNLFPAGINILLLQVTSDDITDNIEIICPTNHYAKEFYNPKKPTYFIIKRGEYYEPIYNVIDTLDKRHVHKGFYEHGALPQNIRNSIHVIKEHIENNCKPLNSQPDVYHFKENIGFKKLLDEVKKIKDFVVDFACINYLGKVVGLQGTFRQNKTGFLPCYPSAKMDGYTYNFVYDINWHTYKETTEFLNAVKRANQRILCKPQLKIEEDGLIIGILTETNQFIQLSQPEQETNDGLETIKGTNYLIADRETLLNNNTYDKERVEYIRKIRLEKNFYNVFRNSLRIELNKYEHQREREEIIQVIDSSEAYSLKMKKMIKLIHTLLDSKVEFVKYNKGILKTINHISMCNTCDEAYCMKSDNGCQLMIPDTNLMNRRKNQEVYFARLSDELIRYTRIRLFMLDPTKYLVINNPHFKVNTDEILLLSSMLSTDYFKDLLLEGVNDYSHFGTYDTTNPEKTLTFDHEVKKEEEVKSDCNLVESPVIGKWTKQFPKTFKEVIFEKTVACTFRLIIEIMPDLTIERIKEVLVKRYETFTDTQMPNVLAILKEQGKARHIDNIKAGMYTLDSFILSDEYYLTNLDIWILALELNIPVVFISSTRLKENKTALMSLQGEKTEWFIIKSPPIVRNQVGSYRLLKSETYRIKSTELSGELNREIENNLVELVSYVENFKATKKVPVLKKSD